MAKGRMLSKVLSVSERRARLHQVVPTLAEFCQALYPLVVAHTDDFGRLQGGAFSLKHTVDPSSPRTLEDFATAIEALDTVGLVQRYEVGGREYLQVWKFSEHQVGLHKRTRSKFPAPPTTPDRFRDAATDTPEPPAPSGKFPESSEPPETFPAIPSELNRIELKKDTHPAPAREPSAPPAETPDAAAVPLDEPPAAPPTPFGEPDARSPQPSVRAPVPGPVSAPGSGAHLHGSHASHVQCGRVCVPAFVHHEFVAALNRDDADQVLRRWYADVLAEWTSGAHARTHTGGGQPAFWRARFRERWPPPTQGRDDRRARPAGGYVPSPAPAWACPHVTRCGNCESCAVCLVSDEQRVTRGEPRKWPIRPDARYQVDERGVPREVLEEVAS